MNRHPLAAPGRLLVLAALAFAVLTAAAPAPADVTRSSSVWAVYSYYLEEGDCRTAASVSVGREMPRGGTESMTPVALYLSLSRFGCAEGTNYGIGAFREIPAHEFQVDSQLAGATLNTAVTESDWVSGRTLELTIHLEWTNNGEFIDSQLGHTHVLTPGSVTNGRYSSLWSGADVTGSISDGEIEYAREPSAGAFQEFESGSVFNDRARMEAALRTASTAAVSGSADTQSSSATARWTDTDPTGCITREAVLLVTSYDIHSPDESDTATYLNLSLTSFNACTGETPYWIGSYHQLGEGVFSKSHLESASLTGSVEAIDSVTMLPVTIDLDLTWTGTGGITRFNNGFVDRMVGWHMNMHELGSYRDATPTGTISIGSQNFLPDELDYARLENFHSSGHYVQH
jgi:hypothetical protein